MACTMRLASDNAKLGQPEVKLGIIPGYGGSQRLPRLVGKGIAMQMVLAGEMITAQEAHRIGLVNEVTAAGGVDSARRGDCGEDHRQCSAGGAVCDGGRQQRHGDDVGRRACIWRRCCLAVCCATEDKKEGTTAFLEKRAAQFKGK